MPDYFRIEAVPDKQYFRCDRLCASISTDACAVMWRQGNHENNDARYRCKACPTGAIHAGETAASMSPLMGAPICARCHRGASRLIGKMICVSCYNRQREFERGKNAKGTLPVKLAPLHYRRIRFQAGEVVRVLELKFSVDTAELMVAALRDSKKRVRFAFDGRMRGSHQLRLF